ncbi:MAG: hypothetical protein GTO30_16635 [Acidobacteria bacterium]|nr:hypothetical protein [Acidobacteriota bacterium]NIQ84121.1 hypothetical protein [Acidobacteriota bacterium]
MNWTGRLGAIWGAAGVIGTIVYALVRILPKAVEAYETGLDGLQWSVTIAFVFFMAYTEGYRGFQLRFSPRTAARLRHLREQPTAVRAVLAPFFAMGFFHANRRTLAVAYGLTFGITILVVLVRLLEQPWRGIVAGGVVVGLTWGVVSLAASIVAALTRADYGVSPEVG